MQAEHLTRSNTASSFRIAAGYRFFNFSLISGFALKGFRADTHRNTSNEHFLRFRLTCVRHHQPPSSMTKHRGRLVERPAGSQSDLRSEEVFASSAQRRPHRSVVGSQAPWKCLRVGHDMVLCPLCHPWRRN